MADSPTLREYPWKAQSEILGNLAIGNLRNNLLQRLTTERGVHAESLMTAIGALVGFAAQNAALVRFDEVAREKGQVPSGALAVASTGGGELFLLGDWINRYLYIGETESEFPLWGFLAGASGLTGDQLPSFVGIARYVSSSIGEGTFGQLRYPEGHRPSHLPLEFLSMLWTWTEDLLKLPPPSPIPPDAEPPLKEIWWPIIASIVAGQFVAMAKGTLAPALCVSLTMESAVITSKVNPEKIVPGRWQIGPNSIRRAS